MRAQRQADAARAVTRRGRWARDVQHLRASARRVQRRGCGRRRRGSGWTCVFTAAQLRVAQCRPLGAASFRHRQAIRPSPSAAGAIARAPFARRQGILLAAQTPTGSGIASVAGRSGILRCRRATWIACARSVEKRERLRNNYWSDVCTHVWCGGEPYGHTELVPSFCF